MRGEQLVIVEWGLLTEILCRCGEQMDMHVVQLNIARKKGISK